MRRFWVIINLFFLSSIISAPFCYCQSDLGFAPIGAKWHYSLHPFDFPQIFPVTYSSFECIGDTIINGKPSSIMKYTFNPWADNSGLDPIFFLHYDSNMVYWYNRYRQVFNLLWNFNAEIGDSWTIKLQCDSSSYPWFISDSMFATVDTTFSLVVNGILLKGLVIRSPMWSFAIAERIGSFGDPFPQTVNCTGIIVDNTSFPLRCYEDSLLGLYMGSENIACDSIYIDYVGLEDPHKSIVDLYPNPAKDHLTIESVSMANQPMEGRINLIDVNGGEVLSQPLKTSKERLDLSALSPGIYFAKIEVNGFVEYRKLVKE